MQLMGCKTIQKLNPAQLINEKASHCLFIFSFTGKAI
jgi:hypothetical protein